MDVPEVLMGQAVPAPARLRLGPSRVARLGTRLIPAACIAAALAGAATLTAQTVTLQASADTALKLGSPNKNFGGEPTLVLKEGGNRMLIRFDQAGVTAAVGGGSLASALLQVYVGANAGNWGATGRTVDVYRLATAWTESGATWNCAVDPSPGHTGAGCVGPWTGATPAQSANGPNGDGEATDTALIADGTSGWVQFDVTADVVAFLAGTPNDGWLIQKTDEGQAGRIDLVSREGTAGLGPRLILVSQSAAFDTVPPALAIVAPSQPVLVNVPSPAIGLAYRDPGSGVDTSTLKVALDGQDLTAGCTVGAQAASCTPPPLAAGTHTITASLSDHAGNVATTASSFRLLLGPSVSTVTFPVSGDTYITAKSPDREHGRAASLLVAKSGPSRALVQFDPAPLAAALAGNQLLSAQLELTIAANGNNWGASGRTIGAYFLTTAWSESAATWDCPADSNLDNRTPDCAAPWNGGAFAASPTATTLITRQLAGMVAFDVTADVAAQLAGATRAGWLIGKTDETESGRVDLVSREAGTGQPAQLVVVFQVPSGDTTPPVLSNLTPADGSFVLSATPALSASFADAGSGIDPTSAQIVVDGADQTASALTSGGNLTYVPASPLAEGAHNATFVVRDLAGNQAQSSVHFTVDTVPPALSFTAPGAQVAYDATPAIALTYGDATSGVAAATLQVALDGIDLTARCTATATAASCTPPALAGGQHTLSARLQDVAGNLAATTATFKLSLDTQPPTLTIASPSSALVAGGPPVAIQLQYSDAGSGVDTTTLHVVLDGADLTAGCTVAAAAAQCPPQALARGSHTLAARLADHSGNLAAATLAFQVVFPVQVAFSAPVPDTVTGLAVTQIAGTVSPQAVAVTVNGIAAAVANGSFTIANFGLHDGVNDLVAVAQDAAGNVGTASERITVDLTPPQLSISFPAAGSVTAAASVAVVGLVSDLTIGTVSDTEVTVTVNGVPASVNHRSFLAPGVPLAAGANTIVATAVDRAGNRATAQVQVTQRPAAGAPSIQALSGDLQTAPVLAPLPQPLVVQVSDAAGQPLAGRQVLFQVVEGNGSLGGGGRSQVATSDAQGTAAATLTLGNRAGLGVNAVRASAVGIAGEVVFSAISTPTAAATIDVASGDNQRGGIGTDLPLPLIAAVTDGHQNPLPGVAVTFKAVLGGGTFAGAPSVVATTDSSGLARAALTLGPAAGFDSQRVEASFSGMTVFPATFKASAFVLGDPAATAISGVVLDNQGTPVPGITMRLRGSPITGQTDAQGQFRLGGVPVGQVFLIADATTTTRPGSWASLKYQIFALAGVENTLPRPIYVLPLDLAHGVMVDEAHGGTVTIPGVPGFALDVAPGSVTFPGGGRNGLISVTAVHADRVPMPPGAGMQPRLIVTIQPAGARFDPPAALTLPNVEGLLPGTVTELFSFDHDLGEFVSIGTATVSEDALTVRSDPGFGVIKAGWHCGAPVGATGIFASLSVAITSPQKPIILCPGGPATLLTANGAPATDGLYDWEIDDPSVADLFIAGPGQCPDQAACTTSAFGQGPGMTTVRVNFTCTTSGATTTDTSDVWVPQVQITDAQVCGDSIATTLGPPGFPGEYTFTLRLLGADGGTLATILTAQRGAGPYVDNFNLDSLPVRQQFATLQAEWTVNGCQVRDNRAVPFESLGVIRHTQYNCPSESDPSCGGGAATPVCFSDTNCNYSKPEQAPGAFVAQVLGLHQGTGCATTPNHGAVQQEAFCQHHGHPFPTACGGNVLRGNIPGISPACGGSVSDGTVAINLDAFAPFGVGCGATICLPRMGGAQKTVNDNCPGCDLGSIDDFSSSGQCGIHDFGTTLTLKVQP